MADELWWKDTAQPAIVFDSVPAVNMAFPSRAGCDSVEIPLAELSVNAYFGRSSPVPLSKELEREWKTARMVRQCVSFQTKHAPGDIPHSFEIDGCGL